MWRAQPLLPALGIVSVDGAMPPEGGGGSRAGAASAVGDEDGQVENMYDDPALLAEQLGVHAFPSFKLIREGMVVGDYHGARDADGIVDFLKTQLRPSVHWLSSTGGDQGGEDDDEQEDDEMELDEMVAALRSLFEEEDIILGGDSVDDETRHSDLLVVVHLQPNPAKSAPILWKIINRVAVLLQDATFVCVTNRHVLNGVFDLPSDVTNALILVPKHVESLVDEIYDDQVDGYGSDEGPSSASLPHAAPAVIPLPRERELREAARDELEELRAETQQELSGLPGHTGVTFTHGPADSEAALMLQDELVAIVAAYLLPPLVRFSEENFDRVFQQLSQVFVLCFVEQPPTGDVIVDKQARRQLHAQLEILVDVARSAQGQYVFLLVPPQEHHVRKHFDLDDDDVSALAILDMRDDLSDAIGGLGAMPTYGAPSATMRAATTAALEDASQGEDDMEYFDDDGFGPDGEAPGASKSLGGTGRAARKYLLRSVPGTHPADTQLFSDEDIWAFLDDFELGRLTPHLRSQSAEEARAEQARSGNVKILTGESFHSEVFEQDHDVLVQFHVPECAHCKALAATYEELADVFSPIAEIDVAMLDASKNEVVGPAGLIVEGFPSIYFFPRQSVGPEVNDPDPHPDGEATTSETDGAVSAGEQEAREGASRSNTGSDDQDEQTQAQAPEQQGTVDPKEGRAQPSPSDPAAAAAASSTARPSLPVFYNGPRTLDALVAFVEAHTTVDIVVHKRPLALHVETEL